MTTSIKVKHENVAATAQRLMRRLDTIWATRSLSDVKQLGTNLSNIRNLARYSTTDVPSYLRDQNAIFYFTLMVVEK